MKRITMSRYLTPAQIEQAFDPAVIVVTTVNKIIAGVRLRALADRLSIDEKTMQLHIREDDGLICFKMEAMALSGIFPRG